MEKCISRGYEKVFGVETLARKNNVICNIVNQVVNGCYISYKAIIPKDLRISYGNIVIASGVKIGNNVIIGQNTTIGGKDNGYPEIGNNVRIYANCIIVGKIKIGDNCIIGAGSFIDKDVPSNSVVYNKKEMFFRKLKKGELGEHSL